MESLKKWKINYLSPSSIATFIENPAMYVMEKIFNYKFKGSAAASRGTFIEMGVNQILNEHMRAYLTELIHQLDKPIFLERR